MRRFLLTFYRMRSADGSLDRTFDPGAGPDTSIDRIALQFDRKLIVGGLFKTFSGYSRIGIARLLLNTTANDFDGDGKTDVSVFRPSSGAWFISQARSAEVEHYLDMAGIWGSIPAPCHFFA